MLGGCPGNPFSAKTLDADVSDPSLQIRDLQRHRKARPCLTPLRHDHALHTEGIYVCKDIWIHVYPYTSHCQDNTPARNGLDWTKNTPAAPRPGD